MLAAFGGESADDALGVDRGFFGLNGIEPAAELDGLAEHRSDACEMVFLIDGKVGCEITLVAVLIGDGDGDGELVTAADCLARALGAAGDFDGVATVSAGTCRGIRRSTLGVRLWRQRDTYGRSQKTPDNSA